MRIEISSNSRLTSARKKLALDQVAYENEARGTQILKIQAIRQFNKGTIVDGRVKN